MRKFELWEIVFFGLIIVVLMSFMSRGVFGLAWVSIVDYMVSKWTIPMPSIVGNKEIIWTQEMENKRLEALKPKKVEKTTTKVEKPQEKPKEVTIDNKFDINRLARAVAMAETHNCTKGYGKTYNNCFWIKNGNTAPCPKIGKNKMCIYEKPEDSYEAFKKIWGKWYKTMPNLKKAEQWTGKDSAHTWIKHVNHYYYQK